MSKIWTDKPPLGSQINWSHPLSRGLVGCWLFNERGGIVPTDIAKQQYSLAIGNPFYNILGKNCISSNNATGYFKIINSRMNFPKAGNVPLTILASVYTTDRNNRQCLISFGEVTNNNYNYPFGLRNSATNVINVAIEGDVGTAESSLNMTYNKWNVMGVSQKSASNRDFFLNGIFQNNTTSLSTTGDTSGGASLLNYYSNQNPSSSAWKGYAEYIYVWNRPLSPSEIQQLYVAPYQFITRPTHPKNNGAVPLKYGAYRRMVRW